jgi:hypothetical protein
MAKQTYEVQVMEADEWLNVLDRRGTVVFQTLLLGERIEHATNCPRKGSARFYASCSRKI